MISVTYLINEAEVSTQRAPHARQSCAPSRRSALDSRRLVSAASFGGRRATFCSKRILLALPSPRSTVVPLLSFACLLIGSSSRSTDSCVWLNLSSATHPIDHAREPKDKINDKPRHPSQLVVIRARLTRPVFFIAYVSEIVIGRHRGRFLRLDFV